MGSPSAALQGAREKTGVLGTGLNPLQFAGAGVGLIGTIAQGIVGAKQRREALDQLKRYQRQELTNIAEGLGVSTLGAELRTREAQRSQVAGIAALQGAGTRALVGGLPSLVRQSNIVSQQAAADLDIQQKEIDRIRAMDEARIRDIQEQREMQDIAGLGQLAEVGTQNLFGAIGAGTRGLFSLGNIQQQNDFLNRLSDQYFGRPSTTASAQPTAGLASIGGYALPLNYNPIQEGLAGVSQYAQ